MRESRHYLLFFKENALIFIVLSFVGLGIGAFYNQNQKIVYSQEQLFEMKIDGRLISKEVEASVALIDHVVTIARSRNLATDLSLGKNVIISSVRFSPFAFKLVSSSLDGEEALKSLKTTATYLETRFNSEYISSNYRLEPVGTISESKSFPNIYFRPLIGFLVGFCLAFLTSLIRTYLKKY